MLVETDSEAKVDANLEACLFEADSDALSETDVEFISDSDALVEAETETLADSEINSDTEAD
ncbi:Uncharacterised protein [Streptococcus australis]|uniref:Uncharacterized protein n=1 Tax=Streptococcus viridans TaxID=78535 RepID=A0A3S4PZ25_9STRE|nr:Uncharacterised protein [Streptococcus viridans]VEE19050.1 Uncharacterised protein [Streptococcus australis]